MKSGRKKGCIPWNKGKKGMQKSLRKRKSMEKEYGIEKAKEIKKKISLSIKKKYQLDPTYKFRVTKQANKKYRELAKIGYFKKGIKLSKKTKQKISKSLKQQNPLFRKEHLEGVEDTMKNLEFKGFKVISIAKKPIPDLIAIKDNRVYAVEVEYIRENSIWSIPFEKYDNIKIYDDIFWVINKTKIPRVEKNENSNN